jgi:hypothetical protein
MSDLNQIVEFRRLSNGGCTQRPSIYAAVGANFDIILNDDVSHMSQFDKALSALHHAEAFGADNRPWADANKASNMAPFANDGAGTNRAFLSNACSGFYYRHRANGGGGVNLCIRSYECAGMDAAGFISLGMKQIDEFRQGQGGLGVNNSSLNPVRQREFGQSGDG